MKKNNYIYIYRHLHLLARVLQSSPYGHKHLVPGMFPVHYYTLPSQSEASSLVEWDHVMLTDQQYPLNVAILTGRVSDQMFCHQAEVVGHQGSRYTLGSDSMGL